MSFEFSFNIFFPSKTAVICYALFCARSKHNLNEPWYTQKMGMPDSPSVKDNIILCFSEWRVHLCSTTECNAKKISNFSQGMKDKQVPCLLPAL